MTTRGPSAARRGSLGTRSSCGQPGQPEGDTEEVGRHPYRSYGPPVTALSTSHLTIARRAGAHAGTACEARASGGSRRRAPARGGQRVTRRGPGCDAQFGKDLVQVGPYGAV